MATSMGLVGCSPYSPQMLNTLEAQGSIRIDDMPAIVRQAEGYDLKATFIRKIDFNGFDTAKPEVQMRIMEVLRPDCENPVVVHEQRRDTEKVFFDGGIYTLSIKCSGPAFETSAAPNNPTPD